ncbi:MAG: zf-HC2 domain-containing protein [Myxococcota bacterium]
MQTRHPDIEQLSAWLEGDLEPATHASLQAHVAGCAHCQAEVEGLREFLNAVQQLPTLEAPAGFTQRVMEQVEQAERRTFRYWLAKLKLPTLLVPVTVAALALFMIRQPEQESLEVESIQRWEQAGSGSLQEADAVPAGEAAAPAPSASAIQDLKARADSPAAPVPGASGGVAQGGGVPAEASDRAPRGYNEAPEPSAPAERASETLAARPASGPVPAELPPLEQAAREKSDAFAPALAGGSMAYAPAPPRAFPAPSAAAPVLGKMAPAGDAASLEEEGLAQNVQSRRAEKPAALPAEVSTESSKLEMARDLRTQSDAPKLAREEAVARTTPQLESAGGLLGKGMIGNAGYGGVGYGSGAGLGAAPERKRADQPATTSSSPAADTTTGAASEVASRGAASAETGVDKTSPSKVSRAPAAEPAQVVAASRAPASTSVRDVLVGGRSKKSQTLAEAIEAQASSPADGGDDEKAKDKDDAASPPFWQDQLPPDAVVVVQDQAGLDEQLTRITRLLKAQRSPLQRLENNRRRVILQLKPDQYPLLIQQLDRHSDFGATPPPGKPTTQRVWVEIVPVVP